MLFILASLILFTLLLAGCGRLCRRALGLAPANPWLYPWLGFFLVSNLAAGASLFLPLNNWSLLIFAIAGLVGLAARERARRQNPIAAAQPERAKTAAFRSAALAALVCVACRLAYTEWPALAYDTDLYHANALRWLNAYGSPPGLANLHPRLGFNSAWLTFAALLDNGPWDDGIAWIMPGLCTLGALLYFLHEVLFGKSGRACRVYALCMLAWTCLQLKPLFPSLYYDSPALLLNAILLAEALRAATSGVGKKVEAAFEFAPGDECDLKRLRLLAALAAAAFTIKPLCAVSAFFTVVFILYALGVTGRLSSKNLLSVFWPAALAALIWMSRNAVLSGYLLFPLPIGQLPFDWSLPRETAKIVYEDVLTWARMPGPDHRQALNGWGWLRPWLSRQTASPAFLFLMTLPFLAALPMWILAMRCKNKRLPSFFAVWSLSNLLYWFFSAPDPRFGRGFFAVFFALAAALAAQAHHEKTRTSPAPPASTAHQAAPPEFLLVTAAAALLLCLGLYSLSDTRRSILTVGIIPSAPLLHRPFDAATPALVLYFPQNDDRCGNSPLPCSPADHPVLPRVKGALSGGFYSP